MCSLVIVVP
uniref:Uncharacterized protein n=1 Tax=Arundo donax TaxID=35708 RepID=A0A0A9G229_ARUDO